jgi:histidinol-phosphate aminotransferase
MTVPAAVPLPRVRVAPYRPEPAPPVSLIRLDRNEGAPADPALLAALAATDPRLLREYPTGDDLAAALADRFAVDPAGVLVTNGADAALDRVCRLYLASDRELLLVEPTFEMFPRYAALAGAAIRAVPWGARFPADAVVAQTGAATGVVALVSPNNPTGLTLTADDLVRVARAVPRAIVLLDHVYAEYADRDLTGDALGEPNVVVVRTFSKAWGLAGCRVGYALGDPAVIEALRGAGDPYPVAGLSLALARAALRDGGAWLAAHVSQVRGEREDLLARLRARGIACPASEGNFVLPCFGEWAESVWSALARAGFFVRRFPDRPDLAGSLRLTLPGDAAVYARLTAALDGALARSTAS